MCVWGGGGGGGGEKLKKSEKLNKMMTFMSSYNFCAKFLGYFTEK